YFVAEAGTSLDSILEGSEEAGRRIVDEAAEWAAEAGVEYDTELVWGRVPEVICRVAQERDCDLIVVGSRGLTGFKRLMLGSISYAVFCLKKKNRRHLLGRDVSLVKHWLLAR